MSTLPLGFVLAVLAVAAVGLLLLAAARRTRAFLDPIEFKAATLIEKETVTHNTKRFRFALPGSERLGLPVGQHVSFKVVDGEGRDVMRPYTPVTGDEARGHVDFVIKIYPQGRMSQHLAGLSIGDRILMRGPKGRFVYTPNMYAALGMIAGGSGITPMYQIAREIARNPADTTRVSIVFANVSVDDILIRRELDALAREHGEQVHLHYVLDRAPPGWTGSVGYVTADVVREHCPPPRDDAMLLFCGPRPMTAALRGVVADLGYSPAQWHEF